MKKENSNLSVKQRYEAPLTRVVELQQRTQLMEISGGLKQPNNYENGGNPFVF